MIQGCLRRVTRSAAATATATAAAAPHHLRHHRCTPTPSTRGIASRAGDALCPISSSPPPPPAGGVPTAMDARSKFLFDLNGYVVVRGAIPPEEVDEMNRAIDGRLSSDALRRRDTADLKNAVDDPASAFSASGPRMDMGGILDYDETPLFRKLLAHPGLVPHLVTLLGEGYRLDHQPMLIIQNKGSEGFSLHGGPLVPSGGVPAGEADPGHLNPELQYRCHNGSIFNSLLAMSVALCDTEEGDGGYVVVKGSHKLNFAVPHDFATFGDADGEENVYHPKLRKGDVLFFSEATVHGAIPWRAEHQRRLALYRFSPANLAYGRAYIDSFSSKEAGEALLAKCTPEQRAVIQYPFSKRLDRTCVVPEDSAGSSGVSTFTYKRMEVKKEHDRAIFGTDYY
eukprot:TRINITY_DN3291_c0_g3_i1.p1 TRINITY_DN3291_c0_g3~~TRINITY_DN3291_c0_g3_i1.p1  ORF type:complete len:397 (+),score=131.01 TRINITY_DN3291_c0_g3_i1:124-1314(+)